MTLPELSRIRRTLEKYGIFEAWLVIPFCHEQTAQETVNTLTRVQIEAEVLDHRRAGEVWVVIYGQTF